MPVNKIRSDAENLITKKRQNNFNWRKNFKYISEIPVYGTNEK